MTIEFMEPGLLTTIQDLGRTGLRHYGIAVGGALDTVALRLANVLVGNGEQEATLEITAVGPSFRCTGSGLIALCGGDLSPTVDGIELPQWRPVSIPAGAVVEFGEARHGWRAYIAIAGGLDVAEVMGSRSTWTRAGIGGVMGRAVRRGDILHSRDEHLASEPSTNISGLLDRGPFWSTCWRIALPYHVRRSRGDLLLRVISGAEFGEFAAEMVEEFLTAAYTVTTQSDRMGYRLSGPAIRPSRPLELLSEGVAVGTIQIPPDGEPIVLLADCQTIGGYPRIAHIATVDLPLIAQAKPGDTVRFERISLDTAQMLYVERERMIERLKRAIALKIR